MGDMHEIDRTYKRGDANKPASMRCIVCVTKVTY